MTKKLPATDVVIVGLGWAGSILAKELCDQGLNVIGLERGPWRDTAKDFNVATAPDELRYNAREELMLRPAQNTCTMRNNPSETALPMRFWGSFHPGNGTGGAGNHWAGITFRYQPADFRLASHLRERYGKEVDPALTLQDWGITWEEMEPFMTLLNGLPEFQGKPVTSKAVLSKAETRSKVRAPVIIQIRQIFRPLRKHCLPKLPPKWVTNLLTFLLHWPLRVIPTSMV